MIKIHKIIIIFLVFTALSFSTASANERDVILESISESITAPDNYNFDFNENMKNVQDSNFSIGFRDVLEKILNLFFSGFEENKAFFAEIVLIGLLSGIIPIVCDKQTGDVAQLVSLVVLAAISLRLIKNLSGIAEETIDSLLVFMQSLIPSLFTLSFGNFLSFQPAVFIAMQIFIYICKNWFLPMIILITVLSVANSISTKFHITKLVETCRLVLKWAMGLIITIYLGLLSLYGFSFSVSGGLTAKTMKYAASSLIPVVGSLLSESSEAISGSFILIKNSLGVVGMITVLYMCLSPLISILLSSFIYRLSGAISEPVAKKQITSLIFSISSSISLIFSVLLLVCIMVILSIAILLAATHITR